MLSRLEAIQDIRLGRGICLPFTGQKLADGRTHTFRVILRRSFRGAEAAIDCMTMRQTYYINLTPKQVLAFIRRHYPRKVEDLP